MKISKRLRVFFFLLMLLGLGVTNSMPFVQETEYNIVVDVSSPIQNETYFTNEVPLSFSYNTGIINSSSVANYTLVLTYNLDGQPIFDMFGNTVFGGESTRIGEFYQPVPLWWSAPIHVTNGTHSLFVLVTFWVRPTGEYQNVFKVQNVSQVVNFTVSLGTPTPTTEEPLPVSLGIVIAVLVIIATLALVVVILAKLLVYYRKKRR